MNVANLQLQGLMMALVSINKVLVDKGILSAEELDHALRGAEANLTAEDRLVDDLSPSNRDAICFPIRLLLAANRGEPDTTFSSLSKLVGETKQPYGDQA